jgi:uncharacterized protein
MNCPICNVQLMMNERQGIEIDYCPTCRGVWLDRGELDKIIERSMGGPSADPGSAQRQTVPYGYPEPQGHHGDHHGQHGHSGQYRRKSWLTELFD